MPSSCHSHEDHHASAHSHTHTHSHDVDLSAGVTPELRRILIIVIAINAAMFIIDMAAGSFSGSQSLMADGLDFLGDTLTYGLSLWALSWSIQGRARATIFKSGLLVLMALYVLVSTLYHVFVLGIPIASVMISIATLALIANAVSVLLVMRFRQGDSNLRSVWLCSRNDMFGNIVVIVAALGVFGTGTAWPDLIVAGIMSGLFLQTAFVTFRHARKEIIYNSTP